MVQGHPDTQYIDWVIAGPETGPGARPAKEEWFRSLRDQCHVHFSTTPFFLKKNADGGRLLDGREWNEVPS
jgi:protein gp37